MRIVILPDPPNNTPLAVRKVGVDAKILPLIQSVIGGGTPADTADQLLSFMVLAATRMIREQRLARAGSAEKVAAEETAAGEFDNDWTIE